MIDKKPYIDLGTTCPGAEAIADYNPNFINPLFALADTANKSNLSKNNFSGVISAYVSRLNKNEYGFKSDYFYAKHNYQEEGLDFSRFEKLFNMNNDSELSKIEKAMLYLANTVTLRLNAVNSTVINHCKSEGMTDEEVHDVVLITSITCMMDRYILALGTTLPAEGDKYYTNINPKEESQEV